MDNWDTIINKFYARLEVILRRIDIIPEMSSEIISHNRQTGFGNDIFIVHGHDEDAKQTVKQFIEELGLRAIVLGEQPDGGHTIIEKFEEKAKNVGFAIVLLTPDDTCTSGKRARQNVILELGYFVGRLGRERVRALHKEDVEIPSDLHGWLYIPMDNSDSWQKKLMQEMEHIGIPFDLSHHDE